MSDCSTKKTPPDACGCCEDAAPPPAHPNLSGQDALHYRAGTHASFLEQMLRQIHQWKVPDGDHKDVRPLAALATRSPEDPAIAFMDAWAVAADVLTFYQERIANEGFLRTATERRSILELARAIGYELAPGVAAETFVAFTVDEADGAPTTADVPAGTQIQSIPAKQDEQPQTFETYEPLTVYRSWNALQPRQLRPQPLSSDATHVYLEGTGLNLQPGDRMLLVASVPYPKKVVDVEVDNAAQRTRVDFGRTLVEPPTEEDKFDPGTPDADLELDLTQENVATHIVGLEWDEADLQTFLAMHEWDAGDVLAYVAALREEVLEGGSDEVQAFRRRTAVFGHNAPDWRALPDETRAAYLGVPVEDLPTEDPGEWLHFVIFCPDDNGRSDDTIDLDQVYSKILPDTWVLLTMPGTKEVFTITDVEEAARAEYALSGKTTRITLEDARTGNSIDLADFEDEVRATTVFAESERMDLAALPITDDLPAGLEELLLDGMVLGLQAGQTVALQGEEPGTDGYLRREVLTLEKITHRGGLTLLTFENGLKYSYTRATATLNANVVRANHGETIPGEVLGSGDGAQPHQRFALKKPPLTHVSGGPSGAESTLAVRVDRVLWTPVDSLYGKGPSDKVYTVRLDDDGVPIVRFGDGKQGARLPTGQQNVTATYRTGIGAEGEVDAGTLTLLKTRPFGVRAVTNPLAAAGAEDPEVLDDARLNAPLTVLTLDRIVSLQDYEDFARAFPGVGKAQAVVVWTGTQEVVHLTVADAVTPETKLYDSLQEAIEAARDPLRGIVLAAHDPFFFHLEARTLIDPAYLWEDVKAHLEAALLEAFGFDARAFGQPVTAAEVVEIMHTVEGVVAVDLNHFFKTQEESGTPVGSLFSAVLAAPSARYDRSSNSILPAQLLLISPYGITLSEMSS